MMGADGVAAARALNDLERLHRALMNVAPTAPIMAIRLAALVLTSPARTPDSVLLFADALDELAGQPPLPIGVIWQHTSLSYAEAVGVGRIAVFARGCVA